MNWNLPPDKFHRYNHASFLSSLLPGYQSFSQLLDVGGREGILKSFFNKSTVIEVDVERSNNPNLSVQADAVYLPFKTKSFDLVFLLDVLEHIHVDRRAHLIKESARVSKNGLIICIPNNSLFIKQSENHLRNLHLQLHGFPDQYLEEHRDYGPVDIDGLISEVSAIFPHITTEPDFYLPLWIQVNVMRFLLAILPDHESLESSLNELYNRLIYPCALRDPSYRSFIVAGNTPISSGKNNEIKPPDHEISLDLMGPFVDSILRIFHHLKSHDDFARKLTTEIDILSKSCTSLKSGFEHIENEYKNLEINYKKNLQDLGKKDKYIVKCENDIQQKEAYINDLTSEIKHDHQEMDSIKHTVGIQHGTIEMLQHKIHDLEMILTGLLEKHPESKEEENSL